MIIQTMPYPPAVASGSVMEVVPFAFTAAGTTVTATNSNFGGRTPTAALVFLTGALNGATPSVHACFAMGIADGTIATGVGTKAAANQASTRPRRVGPDGNLFRLPFGTSTAVDIFEFGAFVENGIRLDCPVAATSAWEGFAIIFSDDVTVDAGVQGLGTGTSALTVGSLTEPPDAVMLMGHGGALSAPAEAYYPTFGVATPDGSQRCLGMGQTAFQSSNARGQMLRNDCAGMQAPAAAGPVTYTLAASNFTSNSFDLTPSASTSSDDIIWVSLNFGSRSCKIVDITSPTSTGTQAITGVGFEPGGGIGVMTAIETLNANAADDAKECGFGISAFWGETASTGINRLQSDANTNVSLRTSDALAAPIDATTRATYASVDSYDADGITLDWQAVQGTAKKGFALLVEA